MSTPTAEPETATLSSTSDSQQMLAMMTRFISNQEEVNRDVRHKQEQLFSYIESLDSSASPMGGAAAAAAQVVEEKEEKERQRQTVRNSRTSVYQNNSINDYSTVAGGYPFSPLAPPPVRTLTEQERDRRASHGIPDSFSTPAPVAKIAAEAVVKLPDIDRSRYSPYGQANASVGKLEKFHGDKTNDKDIDVYTFVRTVDFELNRWMSSQLIGRLELVISCTAGPARMWLMTKHNDLMALVQKKVIAAEMAEWNDVVKEQFIEAMGGGQTQRLYEAKLEELKLSRTHGNDGLTKFITSFREYAVRAYPYEKFPDNRQRSLMLGKAFQTRVCESDMRVWTEMNRMMPRPETVEEWELALTQAWATEQRVREQMRRTGYGRYGENAAGTARNKGGFTSSSAAQSVSHMQVEGETGLDGGDEDSDESLNAVAAKGGVNKKGEGQRSGRNRHIDGKMAKQLMMVKRCLLCYSGKHFARECTAPASRPPTEKELKEKADQ